MAYIIFILPTVLSLAFVIRTSYVKLDLLVLRQLIFLRSYAIMSIFLLFSVMLVFSSKQDTEAGAVIVWTTIAPIITFTIYMVGLICTLKEKNIRAMFPDEEDRTVFAALRIYVCTVSIVHFVSVLYGFLNQ